MTAHWVGDFVCQTRHMAENKSKRTDILWFHCICYGWVIGLFLWASGMGYEAYVTYAIGNLLVHFCVDWCTSRATSWLYSKEKIYGFFTMVGFDQLLHFLCLYYTLPLLGS